MFKAAVLFVVSLALSVAAGGEPTCNTAPIQCCQSTADSQSAAAAAIIKALVGVNVQDVTGQIGLNCSPVTVIGVGSGANCASKPLCCKDIHQHGAVAIGCTPIDVTL